MKKGRDDFARAAFVMVPSSPAAHQSPSQRPASACPCPCLSEAVILLEVISALSSVCPPGPAPFIFLPARPSSQLAHFLCLLTYNWKRPPTQNSYADTSKYPDTSKSHPTTEHTLYHHLHDFLVSFKSPELRDSAPFSCSSQSSFRVIISRR